MAILVLALSLFPCTDTDAAPVISGKASYHATSSETTHDHEDYCPPFCHCSCCASIFSIHHQSAELVTPFLPFHIRYRADYLAMLIEVSIPVWQPPQLG